MISIDGIAKHDGVAIAIVARVDSVNGINGVDAAILEEGIRAIRKGLTRVDFPEVVVACDNVVMGVSLKIPGVNTIGIAAQGDMDVPGLDVDVPCVIDLPGLLEAVEQSEFVIVDGNKGVVYIDPDPHTLIHYQHIEEDLQARSKVFIASEHIPARTQTGEMVNVYAHIKNEGQVEQALEEGADGLLVDLRGTQADAAGFYRALMRAAPGKPLVFAVDFPCGVLVEAVSGNAAPGQVTVAFPEAMFDELFDDVRAGIVADPESEIKIGCVASESEDNECQVAVGRIVIDMRKSALLKMGDDEKLASSVAGWIGWRETESALVLLGKNVETVERLVRAGARSIAVPPDKVSVSKYAIRAMGAEDQA